ncbi:MAG: HAMP domain-containing sensor histidine kinase [Gemmatimonadota bacterium]
MRERRWRPGLRGRFLLVVLVAVVLPLVATTAWLGRSVQRASLAAVEQRLDRQLVAAANEVGQRWVALRSQLLDVAEDSLARAVLAGDSVAATAWRERWRGAVPAASHVELIDAAGRPPFTLRTTGGAGRAAASAQMVRVALPVHAPDGRRAGTLIAAFWPGALIPEHFGFGGAAALPGVLAPDGSPLGSMPEGVRLDLPSFRWQGEAWLTRTFVLHDPPLTLALAAPVTPPESFAAAAQRGLLVLLLVLAGTLVLATLLTRKVTAPLERLSATAGEVALGRFEGSVHEAGPPEVRQLARAFNTMVDSLRGLVRRLGQQEAAAAVGQFAASLAHEVRNPVTAVRLDLERAADRLARGEHADDLLRRALEQVDRLDATVQGTLRIARSGNLRLQPIDLRQPVAAALRSAAPAFRERRLPLPSWPRQDRSVPVQGDVAALQQLLLNLLLNAAEASAAAAAQTRVTVELRSAGAEVELRVVDAGVGMTPEQVERACQPFYTTSADGTGLGLTIVRRIAEAHGAELRVDSRPGEGTTVRVVFERAGEVGAAAAADGVDGADEVDGADAVDRSDAEPARSVTPAAPAGAPPRR